MKFERDKLYVVEGITMEYLDALRLRLYHDHIPWPPGEHRDWANGLDAHLHSNVFEYEPEAHHDHS